MGVFKKMKNWILDKQEWFKKNSKKAFWVWVTYQAIKGTITLSFIWIPLFLYWLHSQ